MTAGTGAHRLGLSAQVRFHSVAFNHAPAQTGLQAAVGAAGASGASVSRSYDTAKTAGCFLST
jgi:hypothetical protein